MLMLRLEGDYDGGCGLRGVGGGDVSARSFARDFASSLAGSLECAGLFLEASSVLSAEDLNLGWFRRPYAGGGESGLLMLEGVRGEG